MSGRPSGDPSMRWNEHAYGSWDEMSMGDGRHRRLTIAYAVAAAVCLAAGALVHTFFFAIALLVGGMVAVEIGALPWFSPSPCPCAPCPPPKKENITQRWPLAR